MKKRGLIIALAVLVLAVICVSFFTCQKAKSTTAPLAVKGLSNVQKVTITVQNISSGETASLTFKKSKGYGSTQSIPDGQYVITDINTHRQYEYKCYPKDETFSVSDGKATITFNEYYAGSSWKSVLVNNAMYIVIFVAWFVALIIYKIHKRRKKED